MVFDLPDPAFISEATYHDCGECINDCLARAEEARQSGNALAEAVHKMEADVLEDELNNTWSDNN